METFQEDPARLRDRPDYQKPVKLKQRRFLVMRGNHDNTWMDPVFIWVDDDSSCSRVPATPNEKPHHLVDITTASLYPAMFHSYEVEGRRTAIRCPSSLSDKERGRIFYDIPEGSGFRKAQDWLAVNGRNKPKPQVAGEKKRPRGSEEFD